MGAWTIWMAAGAVLVAAELMTGTFYLLVIAGAMAAGALTAWSGASVPAQFLVASLVGIGGALMLRSLRRRSTPATMPDVLDVGQTVFVEGWNTQSERPTARVVYRDSPWDVELAAGATVRPGTFVIREIRGNRLMVSDSLE